MTAEVRKVVVPIKVDLDVVGCAYLLELRSDDFTESDRILRVSRGRASSEELADPHCLCIEVGGSGQADRLNFDHHGEEAPDISATKQAYAAPWVEGDYFNRSLSDYVDILDRKGIHHLSHVEPPSLSHVFSGLLLVEEEPSEQFVKGLRLLEKIQGFDAGFDFFSSLSPLIEAKDERGDLSHPEICRYSEAKAEHDLEVAEAVKGARWGETSSGYSLASLESEIIGVVGALYEAGADVVVCLNPNFQGVRKFTVAGKGIKVEAALEELDRLDPGWGGPASGTIIGSPWEGSSLSMDAVVEVVEGKL